MKKTKEVDISFKSERTKMASPKLYRTGQARIKKEGYDIHILRYLDSGKRYYVVNIMKGNMYDRYDVKTLPEVRKIIKNVKKYPLLNVLL